MKQTTNEKLPFWSFKMDFTIPFYWIAINILPLQLNKYHVSQLYRKQSLVELSIVSRRYVIGIKIQILFLQEDQLFTDCMIHGEVQGKVKDQRWRNCGKTSIVAKNIFECCIQLFSELVAGYDLLIITICQPTQQSYLIFKNVVFVKLQK